VAYAIGPSDTMFSTDFSFQNLIFWNLFEFSAQIKHHETKPMHPSLSRAFQSDQECNLKHPGSMDLISTKQTNYLASWIDGLKWSPTRTLSKYDLFGPVFM
jgi:hypothetical protein